MPIAVLALVAYWWVSSVFEDDRSQLGRVVNVALDATPFVVVACSRLMGRRARQRALLPGLSPGELQQARRAAYRGPVPTDPRVQEAAARLGEAELSRMKVYGTEQFVPLFTVIGLAVLVVSGFADSPWWWLGGPVVAAAFVGFRRRVVNLNRWHERLTRAGAA